MSTENRIAAKEFCNHHHIEVSFLYSLHEYGLIEITTEEEDCFLQAEQIDAIEKLIRFHYDLHINLEGIDAVQNLLERMEMMQTEIISLRNKLGLYESSS